MKRGRRRKSGERVGGRMRGRAVGRVRVGERERERERKREEGGREGEEEEGGGGGKKRGRERDRVGRGELVGRAERGRDEYIIDAIGINLILYTLIYFLHATDILISKQILRGDELISFVATDILISKQILRGGKLISFVAKELKCYDGGVLISV